MSVGLPNIYPQYNKNILHFVALEEKVTLSMIGMPWLSLGMKIRVSWGAGSLGPNFSDNTACRASVVINETVMMNQ